MIGIGQIGWIGVDIGTSTVKLAQLTRSKKGLRVTGLSIVPRRSTWPAAGLATLDPLSSADEMSAAVSLRSGFRGKRAAATLSMALCRVHTLDRTPGRDLEEDDIRNAIEMATQRSAEDLQFDVWDTETEKDGSAPRRSNILTVATRWSDQLFDDLSQSGWSCQTIDGLPLSLARAVSLVETPEAAPVAALDWGYGKATLCIIAEGRPVYVRNMKNCGLHLLIDKLCEELCVTAEEASCLLQKHGVGGAANSAEGMLIKEIIAEPINQLTSEIQKTVSHVQFHRRTIAPQSLYLFGGGATIDGLAKHLTNYLEINVKTWQLRQEQVELDKSTGMPSCLFGPAIALSALAWEQS